MKCNVDPPEMAAKERSTVLAGEKKNRKKPVTIQEFNIQPCGMPCSGPEGDLNSIHLRSG